LTAGQIDKRLSLNGLSMPGIKLQRATKRGPGVVMLLLIQLDKTKPGERINIFRVLGKVGLETLLGLIDYPGSQCLPCHLYRILHHFVTATLAGAATQRQ
jgi:hypothetical protein